jgi:hypothetical protein
MSWDYHVKHVNIFCKIHIMRSIHKAAGTATSGPDSAQGRLYELVNARNLPEYLEYIENLQGMDAS